MSNLHRPNPQCLSLLIGLLISSVVTGVETPQWIWAPTKAENNVPPGACYFRRTFDVDSPASGELHVAADDTFEVFVNGKRVGKGGQWKYLTRFDLSGYLESGGNAVAIKVVNRKPGPAGLVAQVEVQSINSRATTLVTDGTWKTSLRPLPLWYRKRYADKTWKLARVLGPINTTKPWVSDPLPTAREIATAPSPTRPTRVEQSETYSPTVVDEPAENPLPKSKRRVQVQPVGASRFLKPLQRRFPWIAGKRQPQDEESPGTSAISPPPKQPHLDASQDLPHGADHATEPRHSGEHKAHRGPTSPADLRLPLGARAKSAEVGRPDTTAAESDVRNPSLAGEPGAPSKQSAGHVATADKAGPGDAAPPKTNPRTGKKPQPKVDHRFASRSGFVVERLLDNPQTGSLISLSFNEFGQILAGRENGPLLRIVDTDADGVHDEITTFCDKVTNCQGILALSGMVFVTADGPEGTGLYRLEDTDRDGSLEEVKPLALFDVSASEHGPHGVVLGPDGNLYIVVGNQAKLKGKFDETSPRRHLYEGDLIPRYEDPSGQARGVRSPGGFVLRTDIHGRRTELFASGLRNAYDLAFSAAGQLFTYDSDMESDVASAWYRPTRLYHVLPGSEFGWRSGWAKWPAYYHDSVPPVAETGRGSPTGVVFYEHTVYPAEYRGAAFLADWSGGRILVASLTSAGATYESHPEVFLSGAPLSVTDVDVGPDGALYFVTGGRGKQGSLCRVKWNGAPGEDLSATTGAEFAVQAPQLGSSWGRQKVAAQQRRLGSEWAAAIRGAASNGALPPGRRVQALQVMQWVGPIPDASLVLELSRDTHPSVRRMATYLMSASQDERVPQRLVELLHDADATVRRQACESLVRGGKSVSYEHLEPLLGKRDRALAWAARRALAQGDPNEWQATALATTDLRLFIQAATTLMVAHPTKSRAIHVVGRARSLMRGFVGDEDFVDILRVLQLAMVRGNLSAADVPELAAELAEEFPANHHIMNRELIRLLVRLQVTSIMDRSLEHLNSDLPAEERIHLATHLRFLEGAWMTQQKLQLFKHFQVPNNAGSSVPAYVQNVARDFGKTLTPDEKVLAIQHGQSYPSAALSTLLHLPDELSAKQVRELSELDDRLTANDEVTRRLKVTILAVLARDGQLASMQHLRDVYDRDPQRRREVAIGLAEQPTGENWNYLLRSLPLLDGEFARDIIVKLRDEKRSPRDAEPYRQVIMTGLRLGDHGGDDAVKLLEHWRGFAASAETPPWKDALKAWQNWYVNTYPDDPLPQLMVSSHHHKWDYATLLRHLQGDGQRNASPARGQAVFVKATCAKCHRHSDIGESMGPDLSNSGRRLLVKDVLDALFYPSRTISSSFRAKTIVTSEGQSYTGIVGSGGQDDLVVLRSNGSKIRVPDAEVQQTVASKESSMPEGLLNQLSLAEISDLMEFLLETPPAKVTQNP